MNSSSKAAKSTAPDETPDSLPLAGMVEACWVDVSYLLMEVEDGVVICSQTPVFGIWSSEMIEKKEKM